MAGQGNSDWRSIADLLGHHPGAPLALVGAPFGEASVTPGRCDLAPETVRRALRRISTYDVETGIELAGWAIHDAGDIDCALATPEAAFAPVHRAVAALVKRHRLTLVLGGNNAVTRPMVRALDVPLPNAGLLTLDAHFDLRPTETGLTNGNPVRALLQDGLPGRNICQIGLAPFANTLDMHETARNFGIGVFTIAEVKREGIAAILGRALARLAHCEAIAVDFDIDVIDRAQLPGASGARPGGMPVDLFFAAARLLAAHPKVRLVDLTEFDPSLDVADISALTAGRWVAETVSGFAARG